MSLSLLMGAALLAGLTAAAVAALYAVALGTAPPHEGGDWHERDGG